MGTSPQRGLLVTHGRAGPLLGVWILRGFEDVRLSMPPGTPPASPWPGLPVAPLPARPRRLVLPAAGLPSLAALPPRLPGSLSRLLKRRRK